MTAQDLFREGRLSEAVDAQNAEVRSHPGDADRRYLLFALLAFTGDLDRASRQLDAIGVGDERLQGAAGIYRNLLSSEAERRRVFRGESRPVVPPDPPSWLTRRVGALAGAADDVAGMLQSAPASEPSASGLVDGRTFDSITDTDELLGPTLEIFAGGRYVLLPFVSLRALTIPPPSHVLDLLWTPAHVEDTTGTEADVHLPVLYPGSTEHREDRIRLGRTTEWFEAGAAVRGLGQKVLSFGDGEGGADDVALLAIRELRIGGPQAGGR
jgi:type VI secretion system protein ImpE